MEAPKLRHKGHDAGQEQWVAPPVQVAEDPHYKKRGRTDGHDGVPAHLEVKGGLTVGQLEPGPEEVDGTVRLEAAG